MKYTGGLTRGRNLIVLVIVTCLSQRKKLLIDTRRHTMGRKLVNIIIIKRFSMKKKCITYDDSHWRKPHEIIFFAQGEFYVACRCSSIESCQT